MEFSRQEYWSGLPFPSSAVLPDPGIEPRSPALQADTLPSEPPGKLKTPLMAVKTPLIPQQNLLLNLVTTRINPSPFPVRHLL